jgi:class 3 adenylate cyclase
VGFVLLAYVFPPLLLLERIVLGLLIAAIHWIFYGANTALAATLSILPAFVAAHLFGFFVARSLEVSERKQFLIGGKLMAQKELSESLLLNVLPGPIAQRLRAQTTIIADHHPEVTILFADLVGFTAMAGRISPDSLVQILNSLFSEFDDHCDRLGIEKIKTIGDSYMAVCGLPEPEPRHAEKIAELAIAMQRTVANAKLPAKETLALRIGINTGPVVAGVIGKRKFLYDLWGETVNLASRLEAAGQPGRIHVAKTTYKHLREKFSFEPASSHDIKGVGTIETYLMALDT